MAGSHRSIFYSPRNLLGLTSLIISKEGGTRAGRGDPADYFATQPVTRITGTDGAGEATGLNILENDINMLPM